MKGLAFLWDHDGGSAEFVRTTIRGLEHDEEFLERRIGERPEVLGLHSFASGIRGPFRAFHRVSLASPTGRSITPDIILVSASAHMIAVEVKLADNPELLNRAVVAQVVEYAASIAALDEKRLAQLLGGTSLASLAASWFPDCEDPEEFADVLAQRCKEGNIDLVIACDRSPPGLQDLGGALDRLSALAFRLRVVEVAPWVSANSPGKVLFLNQVSLRTEIVARTQVTVAWRGGGEQPQVTVATTPLEDVAGALEAAKKGDDDKRFWTPAEIRDWFSTNESLEATHRELLAALLDFAERNSPGGDVIGSRNLHPNFGFKVPAGPGGEPTFVWTASPAGRFVYVILTNLKRILTASDSAQAIERFAGLLSGRGKLGSTYLSLTFDAVAASLPRFLDLSAWVQDRAGRAPSAP